MTPQPPKRSVSPRPATTPSSTARSATRSTLQANYNGLLTQINQLTTNSGYNGVNLLTGDSLTIDFNPTGTSSLTITGVTYNAAGLGLDAIPSGNGLTSFQDNNVLATAVTNINAALTDVQTTTETFGAERVDHLDPADLHNGGDQHAADRRQQPGGGGSRTRKAPTCSPSRPSNSWKSRRCRSPTRQTSRCSSCSAKLFSNGPDGHRGGAKAPPLFLRGMNGRWGDFLSRALKLPCTPPPTRQRALLVALLARTNAITATIR